MEKRNRKTNLGLWLVIIGLVGIVVGLSLRNVIVVNHFEIENPTIEKIKIIRMEVSAYSPRVEETDSTPLITASNKAVQTNFVANNCLPFGTKLQIGDKIYEVQDRMNRRYGCDHLDLFMWETREAINWGRQTIMVKIIYD